eukprot:GDKJ01011213.1.p1 GENE.GDKJ01011213.1~~GDKJ01011213.1.p1  ORF type:complete len:386 (+),score=58.34 GDKJ01011213.1:41-1198(+)
MGSTLPISSPNQTIEGKYGRINYSIDGLEIGKHNENQIVLCLHGLNSQKEQFTQVSKFLVPAGYTIIRIDLYGHGSSNSPLKTKFNEHLFFQQINDLLMHLRIVEKINIFGFSMGGCIAAAFSATFPEKVRAVFLAAPGGLIKKKPSILRIIGATSWVSVPILPCFVCSCLINDEKFENLFSCEELNKALTPQIVHNFKSNVRRNVRTMIQASRGLPLFSSHDYYKKLGKLNEKNEVAVAFIWGSQDTVCSLQDAIPFLLEYFGKSLRIIQLSGISHQLLVERIRTIVIESHRLFLRGSKFPTGIFNEYVAERNVFLPPPRTSVEDILTSNTVVSVLESLNIVSELQQDVRVFHPNAPMLLAKPRKNLPLSALEVAAAEVDVTAI